jgi:alpha-1,3-glucosyltransferase
MEITSNIALGDWYRNTTNNDLLYWGLDYPPLTAYHSYLCGVFANAVNPSMVALGSSRGFESPIEKLFMRMTVQISDLIIFVPAIFLLVKYCNTSSRQRVDDKILMGKIKRLLIILFCLLQPGLLLIDHGHFQYNGVCIGFALLAAFAISKGEDVVASVLFCLSMNFKQMSLYYALIFFSALLRQCFDSSDRLLLQLLQVLKLGLTVILTFGCLWVPFCVLHSSEETCLSSLLQVLHRQFPFSRGIFEDKVSNIWYSVSVVYDLRQVLSTQQLVLCSLVLTLALTLPVCCNLLVNRFDLKRFLLALMNGSLAFFLASYQVPCIAVHSRYIVLIMLVVVKVVVS